MMLRRKLKICLIMVVVGLVAITISFTGPGWINLSWEKIYNNNRIEEYHRFEKGHVSIGIWYISLCYVERPRDSSGEFTGEHQEKCPLLSISYLREKILPEEFGNWLLKTILGSDAFAVKILEMQVISSIGIAFGVLGLIGTIMYTRRMAKARCTGLLACVSLFISGGTYFAAMVKTLSNTHFCKLEFPEGSIFHEYYVYFHCPWNLILGGIGSLLHLIPALGFLSTLSRNKEDDDIHVHHILREENQGANQPSNTANTPNFKP